MTNTCNDRGGGGGESPEMAPAVASSSPPCCPENGTGCLGCAACDPLYLPPGRVQNCSMGGDPFILATLRPPQRVAGRLPEVAKGFGVKVGLLLLFS